MLSVLKSEIKKATGVETVTTQDLINRKYESVTREIVVSAATSGNHGRALAWGARMFGCRCAIYMNDGVSAGREEAIAAYGAEVVRVAGNYDRAVQRSYADAEMFGYFAISDEKSAEYPHISREIMQGYAMVADEIVRQFSDVQPPTHVFVPGGGGRLAAATCGHLWERYGSNHPRIVVVEPTASACLYQSAIENSAATVSEDGRSVMDGLVVESASPQAWDILKAGAFAFLTIPDEAAVDAMRQAATGIGGDPPTVVGETGIAAWAGFLAATPGQKSGAAAWPRLQQPHRHHCNRGGDRSRGLSQPCWHDAGSGFGGNRTSRFQNARLKRRDTSRSRVWLETGRAM